MDIKWQDPPPIRRGGRPSSWNPVGDELKKHPGRWALLWEGARSPSTGIDQCRKLGLKRRTHKRDDGKWDIYAKYEGKP